jgi:hypothetical protein
VVREILRSLIVDDPNVFFPAGWFPAFDILSGSPLDWFFDSGLQDGSLSHGHQSQSARQRPIDRCWFYVGSL